MLLALLLLTSLFLALLDGFEHRRHVGYTLIAPKLLVGLLSIEGLTCACAERHTFLVIAMTVAHVSTLMQDTY